MMKTSWKLFVLAAVNLVLSMTADAKFAVMVCAFSAGWCAAFGISKADCEQIERGWQRLTGGGRD